ncbi:MAG: hypothetical protein HYW23_04110 [Candidatus Aenigmarchaeota archaeon]|nr:hypothetical protein [Candidatus Aenigmarchaeota archaeon]
MKAYFMLLIFFFFSLTMAVGSEAIPTCTFRTTCNGGETCVFNVYQQNNSHVGSCDSEYTTKICCTEITSATVRTYSCNAGEGRLVSMYQTANSHAASSYYYDDVVCAKTASNPIVTNIRASCLSRETCALSFYQQNDTHIGACGYYTNQVCVQESFNVTITMILNNTQPIWNESVGLQGVATRSDGTAVDTSADPSDVNIYVNSTLVCSTATNSTGGYTCNFTAPSSIGPYQVIANVTDPTTSVTWTNSTTFTVKQTVGTQKTTETTANNIACYEEPRLIQNPDGTLKVSTVRICVWK